MTSSDLNAETHDVRRDREEDDQVAECKYSVWMGESILSSFEHSREKVFSVDWRVNLVFLVSTFQYDFVNDIFIFTEGRYLFMFGR